MALQVATTSSSGFSSKSIKYRYDVFLSFRGDDTRHSFTVPLYDALRRKGINAFIDDKKLGKGERIAPTLLKAIERSKISIIVFSKNFSTSTWCLDELAHIIWCKKEKNQVVMPIFYKVDPMDIQYQRNSFEEALAAHEERFRNDVESAANEDKLRNDMEKLQKWRSAWFEAASLPSAWILEDGYQDGVFIERIVEDVFARLPPKRFHNVDYIVGLEPCIQKVMSLLDETDNSVCMLGIHGTGGIGKTTLAKALYNTIFYHFEGACFLFDVKEASKKYQGVVRLQQKLLSKILEERIRMFGSIDEGISRIKHRLSHKKVILVLDDVDEVEQLEQLAGGYDWFGCGSKVIITTRNKQLLTSCNIRKTYEMKELDKLDSLELFCWHAFQMSQPQKDYQDMSICAISYAQGLPLALRVIGSNLADKNLEEWRSILEQYEKAPERTILEVLKISYDYLQDGAKCIFLDIACFLNKISRSVKEIIEACDFGARFYLEVLIDKSLITLVKNGHLYMHDLIQQIGREIVRQEAPLNPEKCSRLWYYQDGLTVLRGNLGCNNIEGMVLDPPQHEEVKWSGIAFEKMNNLRILVIRNVQFSTGPIYLPNSLRWLEWEGYPSTILPTDFSPLRLIFLKLPGSSFILKESFKSTFTYHVTEMHFPYCQLITEVPDMSQLQSLRRLNFANCRNLIKVHDSVGSLSKLVNLNVSACTKLSICPREIKMPSLEFLGLNGCKSLDYFPHIVGKMDALTGIYAEGTAIKELPPSIGNLSRLEYLYMDSCKSLGEFPTSLFTLPKLGWLSLGGINPLTRKSFMKLMQDIQPIINHMVQLFLPNCGLLDEELHLILNYFRNLRQLDISKNDFVFLPKCIKQCAEMMFIHVNGCKRLKDIPELPSNLCVIQAENCTSLTAESLHNLYSQAKRGMLGLRICIPATSFPDWLDYWCEGSKLCFRARRGNSLPRSVLAFEVVGKANTSRLHWFLVYMRINGRKIMKYDFDAFKKGIEQKWAFGAPRGHVLLVEQFMKIMEEEQKNIRKCMELDWNEVEIQFMSRSPDMSVVKCGIYVCKKETNMENVHFKPYKASATSMTRKPRAIDSPPNYEPPNKYVRTDNTKKGSK